MRNVQDVVIVCVSDEDEVCARDVRVDGSDVWYREIVPTVNWAGVSGKF